MAASALVLASLVDVVQGVLFALVGAHIGRRAVPPSARRATRMFVLWWSAIALLVALDGVRGFAGAFGFLAAGPVLEGFILLYYAWQLVLCAALWGLLYHLVFLFTGRETAFFPLGAFYGAYWFVLVAANLSVDLTGFHVDALATRIAYANDPGAGFAASVLFVLLLPPVLGAAVYGSLVRHVSEPALRYRVLVVSTSLVVWLGSTLVASVLGWDALDLWQIGRRAIGVSAAVAIYLAYHPPARVRARLEAPREEAFG